MPYKDPERRRANGRKHYSENVAAYRRAHHNCRLALRDEVNQIKELHGCTDCEKPFPYYVLEFDHLGEEEKVASINNLIRSDNREAVMAEIAKCEIVCANCHRVREHLRRMTPGGVDPPFSG